MAGLVGFFYGLGSRYSYLASTQIAQLDADTGSRVRWRPLYSADLSKVRGADPFQGEPSSGQYDRPYRRFDAECWADYYGVPFREPDDVEADWRLLALAATAADRMGGSSPSAGVCSRPCSWRGARRSMRRHAFGWQERPGPDRISDGARCAGDGSGARRDRCRCPRRRRVRRVQLRDRRPGLLGQ